MSKKEKRYPVRELNITWEKYSYEDYEEKHNGKYELPDIIELDDNGIGYTMEELKTEIKEEEKYFGYKIIEWDWD